MKVHVPLFFCVVCAGYDLDRGLHRLENTVEPVDQDSVDNQELASCL